MTKRISELKDGVHLLFNILSGEDEFGEPLEDTERVRKEMLREGEKGNEMECFPAGFRTEEDGSRVPIWRHSDVLETDEEFPFGGSGTYYFGDEIVEVGRRPSVGKCIAVWILYHAYEAGEERHVEVAEAAKAVISA